MENKHFKHQKTDLERSLQDFDRWNNVQKHLEAKGEPYHVKAGEIYWVGLGKNLGTEMDGKGQRYARPMIVIKPVNRNAFIGVPLTSRVHYWPGFMRLQFGDQEEFAVLMQVRICSAKRLYNRMGRLSHATLYAIKQQLREYLELDTDEEYELKKKPRESKAKARRVTKVDADGHETPPTDAQPAKNPAKKPKKSTPKEPTDPRPVTTEDEPEESTEA